MIGYRFTEKGREEEFYRLKRLMEQLMALFSHPILMIVSFSKSIQKLSYRFLKSFYKPVYKLFDFINEQIRQRIETENVDEDMEPRDIVDAFLIEKARQERLNLPTAYLYT
jgi:hypothetical protein